jgi:hypothetical protein
MSNIKHYAESRDADEKQGETEEDASGSMPPDQQGIPSPDGPPPTPARVNRSD